LVLGLELRLELGSGYYASPVIMTNLGGGAVIKCEMRKMAKNNMQNTPISRVRVRILLRFRFRVGLGFH